MSYCAQAPASSLRTAGLSTRRGLHGGLQTRGRALRHSCASIWRWQLFIVLRRVRLSGGHLTHPCLLPPPLSLPRLPSSPVPRSRIGACHEHTAPFWYIYIYIFFMYTQLFNILDFIYIYIYIYIHMYTYWIGYVYSTNESFAGGWAREWGLTAETRGRLKIHQRGVQWKQGVVVYTTL